MKIIPKITIKMQLVLLILIFVISMTSLAIVILKNITNITAERTIKYSEDIIRQMEINIKRYIDDNYRIAKSVAYNKELQKFLLAKDMSERLDKEVQMRSFMENAKMLKDNIVGITIFFQDSHIIYGTLGNIEKLKDIDMFNNKKPFYTYIIKNEHAYYYYYIMPIYDTEVGIVPFERIGTQVVTLNINNFTQLFNQFDLLPNSIIYILDGQNNVVASNEKSITNTVFKEDFITDSSDGATRTVIYNNKKYFLQRKDIHELGWSIFALLPSEELLGDIEPVIQISLIIGILELFISIIISFFIIRGITNSVKQITEFAAKIGFGNVKERLNIRIHNELGIVVNCINSMLTQIEEMTKRIFNTQEKLYKAELNERQAELNALQSQINPHFLYNTLECIRSIAEVHEVHEISDISLSMSNIFRYSIKQSHVVKLSDELNCIKNYFKIMDIRFRGRFRMQMEYDDSLLECEIIKMILQPLVENAIYHGLESKRGTGTVEIKLHRLDDNIMECIVKDDGIGMDENTLDKLLETLAKEQQGAFDGMESKRSIGLLNINNRIRAYYSQQNGLQIESERSIGTTVSFRIPIKGGANVLQSPDN